MDIGKKQQIMVDWFRKTLDESKKPWNTQVYLITDKYHVLHCQQGYQINRK